MTTLEKFRQADKRVTELESKLDCTTDTYVPMRIETEEYKEALKEAQKLYAELETQGINPFA